MRNLFTIQNGKRYLSIILGNLLITGAYAFITVPNKIVNGGVTSFSMILEEVTSINLTYLVDFITILLLLLCYIFLGKTFFTGTVFSCICYLVFFSILHSTGLALIVPPALGKADKRRLCDNSDNGLCWSMNCDNCEEPKNSLTAAVTGRILMICCGVKTSLS